MRCFISRRERGGKERERRREGEGEEEGRRRREGGREREKWAVVCTCMYIVCTQCHVPLVKMLTKQCPRLGQ